MKEEMDIMSLIMFKIKGYKGYTAISTWEDDPGVTLYHYDTKEEFDKAFTMKWIYPNPIDRKEIYSRGFYLAIDGEFISSKEDLDRLSIRHLRDSKIKKIIDKTCPDCDGEGGSVHPDGLSAEACETCNGLGQF
jgi:hypothetical protein